MKTWSYISILFMSVGNLACTNDFAQTDEVETNLNDSITELPSADMIFANEYGEIRLTALNDTLWKTEFSNNDGFSFDTSMVIAPHDSASIFPAIKVKDEKFYLKYHWGGLSVGENNLRVLEFSSYARLQTETQIENIYLRDFFRMGIEMSTEGDLMRGKGTTINGIWIESGDDRDYGYNYATVYGVLHKEEYPEAYYSTDESPQGMFSKDDGIQYRLIFEDADFEKPEVTSYAGSKINISTGEAAIAWDFADSEAYILEGQEPWAKTEVGERIIVSGTLVQNDKGSFIKNWEIR